MNVPPGWGRSSAPKRSIARSTLMNKSELGLMDLVYPVYKSDGTVEWHGTNPSSYIDASGRLVVNKNYSELVSR